MRKTTSIIAAVAVLLCLTVASAYATTKTATIRVEGMKCDKCSASVTKALKAVDGVQKVDVSFEKGVAIVEYDDQKVTEARLREVINATGFKAVEEKTSSAPSASSEGS